MGALISSSASENLLAVLRDPRDVCDQTVEAQLTRQSPRAWIARHLYAPRPGSGPFLAHAGGAGLGSHQAYCFNMGPGRGGVGGLRELTWNHSNPAKVG